MRPPVWPVMLSVALLATACASNQAPSPADGRWRPETWGKRPSEPLDANAHCATLAEPKLVRRWFPEYPPELRKQRITGVVYLTVIVGKDGATRTPEVANSPHPELAKACSQATLQWRYAPILCDGAPVEARVYGSCSFAVQ